MTQKKEELFLICISPSVHWKFPAVDVQLLDRVDMVEVWHSIQMMERGGVQVHSGEGESHCARFKSALLVGFAFLPPPPPPPPQLQAFLPARDESATLSAHFFFAKRKV